MKQETVNKSVLLLIVILISTIFLSMIRNFLMTIILAGIFSALMHPVYTRFLQWFRGKRSLASLATLFVIVFLVILPLTGLVGVVTKQAFHVGKSVSPWVKKQIANPGALNEILDDLPFYEHIEPYRELILNKGGEIVKSISQYLLNYFSSFAYRTVNIVFMTFIFHYTMFFFLMEGDKILGKILYYIPLGDQDERRMLNRFTSVTRATLKGTAVIGILQGGLAGFALWLVGFKSALFWGVVMIVLSVIPLIGTALIWGPAAFILAVSGYYAKAIGLVIFCGLFVGSIDSFLRPILVGKDTQMHELMILFGTLGGIFLFGVLGIIIGPIIAALFVTVWEIYGIVFRDVLPEVSASEFISQKKSLE